MATTSINSLADLVAAQKADQSLVLFFWAPWQDASKPGGQMHGIFTELQRIHEQEGQLTFHALEAEEAFDISHKLGVSVVPTFIFLKVR